MPELNENQVYFTGPLIAEDIPSLINDIPTSEEEETKVNVQEAEKEAEEVHEDPQEDVLPPVETNPQLHITAKQEEDGKADFLKLSKMSYIDLYSQHSKATDQLQQLVNVKAQADAIDAMSSDEFAAMVNMMDIVDKEGYTKSIKDFQEHYDEMYTGAQFTQRLIYAMLSVFSTDLTMSTTFISQSMVESSQDRLKILAESNPRPNNYNLIEKRIKATANAYGNRTKFSMLFNKLKYPANTAETFKEFKEIGPNKAMDYIDEVFLSVFNDAKMARFRQSFADHVIMPLMDEGYEADMVHVMIFFFTFWLAKIYEREFTSGKCAEVKVFVMNVYDCDPSSNIYDLAGGKEFFNRIAYNLFMTIIPATTDEYTAKTIHKKLSGLATDMEKLVEENRAIIEEATPGRKLEKATTLEANYPDVTYETLLVDMKVIVDEDTEDNQEEVPETESNDSEEKEGCDCGCPCCDPSASEEEVTEMLPNETRDFVDLGNQSVDPEIMPADDIDNTGGDDSEEAESSEEPPARKGPAM